MAIDKIIGGGNKMFPAFFKHHWAFMTDIVVAFPHLDNILDQALTMLLCNRVEIEHFNLPNMSL